MSYGRINKEEARLMAEVEALLEQAQKVDEREDAKYGRDSRTESAKEFYGPGKPYNAVFHLQGQFCAGLYLPKSAPTALNILSAQDSAGNAAGENFAY